MKLNAKQLRDLDENTQETQPQIVRNPIVLILENIYDTYNVGGLFRLADGLAASKIYLCAETEIPPNHRIQKASIGTYKVVPWVYKESAAEAIEELKKEGIQVVAVEQDGKSVDYRKFEYKSPVALLVGNETFGVSKEALALCDATVEIPMWGINKSLNVIVSAAIVGFHVMNK
jgi:tRNA G18 (ribose-2'-O)-methylase SpoU